ncbi:MAG: hypothetical protein CSA35_07020 [Dethiosulfovibrio peptidovorans]|nr:MAG: hypothetical protein CSA35_07020 [Dethiosulfovibrio peptidovorans]
MNLNALLKMSPDFIGSKVMVAVISGLYKGEYPSRLEDALDDIWKLAHPLLSGALVPFYKGVEVQLSVHVAGIVCHVTGIVMGTVRDGLVPLLLVRLVGDVERVQRRRFFRVPCALEVDINLLKPPQEVLSSSWTKAVICDLSLGGVRLIVKDEALYARGDRVLLRFSVNDESLFLPAHILSKRRNSDQVDTSLGVGYDFLPGMVEKFLGKFIRKRDLALRNEMR